MSFIKKWFKKKTPPQPKPVTYPAVQRSDRAAEGDAALRKKRKRTRSILTSSRGAQQETLGQTSLLGT